MAVKITIAPAYEHLRPLVEEVAATGSDHPQAEVIYRGRNTVFTLPAQGLTVNVKAYKIPIFINKIAYGLVRGSKARRSYDNAMKLLAAGIPTAAPIAVIEERRAGLLYRSYFLSIHAQGYRDCRYIDQEPDYPSQAQGLAHIIYMLQKNGIVMRDFSPGNVLRYRRPDGAVDFCLIDINRMDFDVRSRQELDRMFGSIVDTDEGVRLLGHEFAEIAGISPAEGEARAMAARKRFLDRIYRKRRLKKLFK